jgi:hypothetical protein
MNRVEPGTETGPGAGSGVVTTVHPGIALKQPRYGDVDVTPRRLAASPRRRPAAGDAALA